MCGHPTFLPQRSLAALTGHLVHVTWSRSSSVLPTRHHTLTLFQSLVVLPRDTMAFAPQHGDIQCKMAVSMVALPSPSLSPFFVLLIFLLLRPRPPQLPLPSPLLPITTKPSFHQPFLPDITVLLRSGGQRSLADPILCEDTRARLEYFRQLGWLPPNYKPKTPKGIAVMERDWLR